MNFARVTFIGSPPPPSPPPPPSYGRPYHEEPLVVHNYVPNKAFMKQQNVPEPLHDVELQPVPLLHTALAPSHPQPEPVPHDGNTITRTSTRINLHLFFSVSF